MSACPICLENISDESLSFLPCWHRFHGACIHKWMCDNLCCPMCNTPFFIESPEQLLAYKTYSQAQLSDESVRRENLGTDHNSIAYRFMVENNIENRYHYSNIARMSAAYDMLEEEQSDRFIIRTLLMTFLQAHEEDAAAPVEAAIFDGAASLEANVDANDGDGDTDADADGAESAAEEEN